MYFDQYKFNESFDQFIGPFINNDYPKCIYLGCVKSTKFSHIRKHLKFLRNHIQSIFKVLRMTYVVAI
jgi:hypothetical protein